MQFAAVLMMFNLGPRINGKSLLVGHAKILTEDLSSIMSATQASRLQVPLRFVVGYGDQTAREECAPVPRSRMTVLRVQDAHLTVAWYGCQTRFEGFRH